ncbi:MAG: tetratricopeptide repeat protein [Flavobacterium sp.]|nr:tetratricopeptide repeat protein [Candidatus Neoflavobacterium equi]
MTNRIKNNLVRASLALFFISSLGYGQDISEAKPTANQQLEEAFFSAIKEKAVENNDKAVTYLLKCVAEQPNNPVFYNELGKNYFALKKYTDAEQAYQKAVSLDPAQKWYWHGLYDVYYQTKQHDKALPIVVKLITFDSDYEDDLVSLYMHTKQFDKALFTIEQMEKKGRLSMVVQRYKFQVETELAYSKKNNVNLSKSLEQYPNDIAAYEVLLVDLIKKNDNAKITEVLKKLQTNIPNSDWNQVLVFENALAKSLDEAQKPLFQILNSTEIHELMKHRVFNKYLIQVHKTDGDTAVLDLAVATFDQQKNVNVSKEVGLFFYNKQKFDLAAHYFVKAANFDRNDIQVVQLLIQTYLDQGRSDDALKMSNKYLEFFPSDARLYFFKGTALHLLTQYKKALEALETALDYLGDDVSLEANIYIQLGEVYNKLGDQKKKDVYFSKANQLLKN